MQHQHATCQYPRAKIRENQHERVLTQPHIRLREVELAQCLQRGVKERRERWQRAQALGQGLCCPPGIRPRPRRHLLRQQGVRRLLGPAILTKAAWGGRALTEERTPLELAKRKPDITLARSPSHEKCPLEWCHH